MNKIRDITIQDLRDYRAICAEIRHKEEELKAGKVHVADTVQSAAEFPYCKHTVLIEGDIYLKNPSKMKKDIIRLRDKKAHIERFVANIFPHKIRQICEIYYLIPAYGEKITWEYVADQLNDGSTGDSCRILLRRYLALNCKK